MIWIGDREVARLAPRERDIAMVFQNYALYPHLSVSKNLGYGLKVRKTLKAEIERRVDEVAHMLGLQTLLHRRPARWAWAAAARRHGPRDRARAGRVFLMDEPLSNLDAKLRVDMRAELARLADRLGGFDDLRHRRSGGGDDARLRVAVMRDGTVQQVDTPQTLYREPDNLFVAAFIGSPSMNLVEARVSGESVEFAGFRIPLAPGRRPAGREDDTVILGLRPQDFEEGRTAAAGLPRIEVDAAVAEEPRLLHARPLHDRGAAGRRRRSPGGDRRRRARDAARDRPPRPLHGRGCGGGARAPGRTDRARARPGAVPFLRSRDRREPPRATAVASAA